MHRRSLKKIAPFILLTACGVVLAAASACSNSPSTPGPMGAAGTNPGTAGAVTTGGGGATSTTGGNATAGSATTAGAGMGGTAGGAAGGAMTGGASGTGGGAAGGAGPACKPVTQINGSGLTLSDPNISAFKLANSPAGSPLTKMAYDPMGKVLVVLQQNGTMSSTAEPMIPAAVTTTPLATLAPYNSGGYAPVAGYTDHRGIVFGPDGTLYVLACMGGGNVGVAIRKGVPGAGGARTWTDLVTTNGGFPNSGTNFDHSFSGIAISPDGMSLYFSSGSRSDHGEMEKGMGEVPLSSAVFKVPTGTPTVLKNDTASLAPFLFAEGTRNSFDMAFNANGDLIATENGPDIDLSDEVNFLEQGKNYGFPYRFGNVNNPVGVAGYSAAGDKRLHKGVGYQAVDNNLYVADPTLAPPAGVTFTDPILNMGPDANVARADANADPAPVAAGLPGVSGHRSPLGIVFDTAGALCGPYYKQGFMLSYGSVLGAALGDPGKDLLFLSLTKTGGAYTMTAKQVAKGIEAPMDAVLVGNKMYTVGYNAPLYVFVLPTP